MLNNTSENLAVHVEKCCVAGQATDNNMAHAHCMLDTYGYKHILRIRNTYYFSTAAIVTGTRLSVTLYVYYPSVFLIYCHLP